MNFFFVKLIFFVLGSSFWSWKISCVNCSSCLFVSRFSWAAKAQGHKDKNLRCCFKVFVKKIDQNVSTMFQSKNFLELLLWCVKLENHCKLVKCRNCNNLFLLSRKSPWFVLTNPWFPMQITIIIKNCNSSKIHCVSTVVCNLLTTFSPQFLYSNLVIPK